MTTLSEELARLRRPRVLVEAAQRGADSYVRQHDRAKGKALPHRPSMPDLMQIEAEMEATRRQGDQPYRARRHVAALITLLGEARLQGRAGHVT